MDELRMYARKSRWWVDELWRGRLWMDRWMDDGCIHSVSISLSYSLSLSPLQWWTLTTRTSPHRSPLTTTAQVTAHLLALVSTPAWLRLLKGQSIVSVSLFFSFTAFQMRLNMVTLSNTLRSAVDDVSMATPAQPPIVSAGFNCRVQRPRGPRDPPAGWSRPERWGHAHWLSWSGELGVCLCVQTCVCGTGGQKVKGLMFWADGDLDFIPIS